jgi:hypothetical protein
VILIFIPWSTLFLISSSNRFFTPLVYARIKSKPWHPPRAYLGNLLVTLACRPSVLNPSFCFLFSSSSRMEFVLALRRLRVQRLSQNAIDSPRFRDLDTIVTSSYLCMYNSRLMPCLWYTFFVYLSIPLYARAQFRTPRIECSSDIFS